MLTAGPAKFYHLLLNRFVGKLVQFLAALLPGLALLKWVDKRPVAALGMGFGRDAFKKLGLGMATGFLMVSAGTLLFGLTGAASFSFNGLSFDLALYLLGILAVLVVSACYEEVLFRGYIFQAMVEGSGLWITLGVFALLFGAAHISNAGATVFSVAVSVLAGVFLGIMYFKTRTLWMCIGAHFMWNWTTAALFGIGIKDSKFARRSLFTYVPSDSGFILGADAVNDIISGLIFAALTILLWRARRLKPSEDQKRIWAKYPPRFGVEPERNSS